MAHQFVWYFTDLPEKVVGIIEDDLKDKFDTEMKDSLLIDHLLIKIKEIPKILGFLLLIGWQDLFGIMWREQIEKTFYMI